MALQAASVARSGMQDWSCFPLYIPDDLWVTLRSQQRHLVKAEALVAHLIKMGLRHPAERTQALVACVVCGGAGDFMTDDVSRQTTLLATIKSVIKNKITRAKMQNVAIPGPYLEQLPNEFDALPLEMRQQVFAGIAPNCPLDLNPFWQAAATWPCRSTHTGVRLVRMQSQLSVPGALQAAMIAQHAAAQAVQVLPAANGVLNAGIPGFQLLPAGVEAAAAAAAARGSMGGTTQSSQLQSLMNRAREPAGSQETPARQLALPAPEVEELPGSRPVERREVVPAVAATEAAPENSTVPASAVEAEAVAAEAAVPLPSSQPSALEAAVADLASAHYGLDVGHWSGNTAVCKKPAAKAMRKPASAKATTEPTAPVLPAPQQKEQGGPRPKSVAKSLKKPAASSAKASMKRPSAKKKVLQPLARAESVRRRPRGCSRCREVRGCTPSCWIRRGYKLQG